MTEQKQKHPDYSAKTPVILQVLPAMVTGGVERGAVEIAKAVTEAGWKSLVASEGGPLARLVERVGARHITLPLASKKPFTIWRNIGRLTRLIEEEGVSLVHARSRAPAWSALYAAEKTGVHFVTTYHGAYNGGGPFGLKERYNSVMARGERIIAVSDFIKHHILSHYPVDPDIIRVIHRGVDVDMFESAKVSPERIIQLSRQWRLPDGHKIIMLPGRLTRWKGQSVLIDALAKLQRKDVLCLLVGSDQGRKNYSDALKAQITRLGLGDQVFLAGNCNDMPAAYMTADVVVLASTDPEAFGRVLVEAAAMGRPVIATNNGAAPEIVEEGKTGLLIPPADPEALAVALEKILSLSFEERLQMAKLAEQHAKELFSTQKMCDQTLEIYREVMEMPIRSLL